MGTWTESSIWTSEEKTRPWAAVNHQGTANLQVSIKSASFKSLFLFCFNFYSYFIYSSIFKPFIKDSSLLFFIPFIIDRKLTPAFSHK